MATVIYVGSQKIFFREIPRHTKKPTINTNNDLEIILLKNEKFIDIFGGKYANPTNTIHGNTMPHKAMQKTMGIIALRYISARLIAGRKAPSSNFFKDILILFWDQDKFGLKM